MNSLQGSWTVLKEVHSKLFESISCVNISVQVEVQPDAQTFELLANSKANCRSNYQLDLKTGLCMYKTFCNEPFRYELLLASHNFNTEIK